MNQPFTAPQDFTAKFPSYVYRSGNGSETVQWRQAALDMANDRAKLIDALADVMRDQLKQVVLDQMAPGPRQRIEKARALLAEMK